MTNINQLKQQVESAEQDYYVAQENLYKAQETFQQALRNRNLDLFDRWQAWSEKNVYEDVSNVEAYYNPPKSWVKLKNVILKKKGIDTYKGGSFNWNQEIAPYIQNRVFVNIPLELNDMIEALECVMDYNVNYHIEQQSYDM